MKNELTKKYGLLTSISSVVGIVIGSRIFYKAPVILTATGGNMPLGVLAWILGGIIMVVCAFMFSHFSKKYEGLNGVVDYAEATCGKKYAYYIAWFVTIIYYPAMASVIAWVTARYFCGLFGFSPVGAECMCLTTLFLVSAFVWNALSPKLAGKIQISATVIKMIPLILMAVVGTIYGLITNMTIENFTHVASEAVGGKTGSLLRAVVATAFAYEGWSCVTTLNSEIKDSKKNLSLGLMIGGIVVILTYVFYYIGISGGATNAELLEDATISFTRIFGKIGGLIVNILIVISCLGTLNGITMASSRCIYSIAYRNEGVNPQFFNSIDEKTNMPLRATFIQLLITSVWLVYFFGANLTNPWFGLFSFDSSELPIITLYAMYIPIIAGYMIKSKEENVLWRFVMPVLSIIACLFMIFAAVYAHGFMPLNESISNGGGFTFPVLFYLIIYILVMFVGYIVERVNSKKVINNN